MFSESSLRIVFNMRTKEQQMWRLPMAREVRSALIRARGTLVQDAAGVLSLIAMLLVALHLPSIF